MGLEEDFCKMMRMLAPLLLLPLVSGRGVAVTAADELLGEINQMLERQPDTPPKPTHKMVEVTNVDDLQREIKDGPTVVMFYATGCEHCEEMHPVFTAAADKLSSKELKFVAIEAWKKPEITKPYGLKGFPTVNFFDKGVEVSKYSNVPNQQELELWVQAEALERSTSELERQVLQDGLRLKAAVTEGNTWQCPLED